MLGGPSDPAKTDVSIPEPLAVDLKRWQNNQQAMAAPRNDDDMQLCISANEGRKLPSLNQDALAQRLRMGKLCPPMSQPLSEFQMILATQPTSVQNPPFSFLRSGSEMRN
jgi:hypothetical protein